MVEPAPEAVVETVAEAITAPPPEGTLEAQALALAGKAASVAEEAPAPVIEAAPDGTLEAQAVALAAAPEVDPALAAARPMARPETAAPEEAPAEAPVAVAAAEEVPVAPPVEELVETVQAPEEVLLAETPQAIPEEPLAEESLAAVAEPMTEDQPEPEVEMVAAKPARNAPIFDSAEPESIELASAEAPQEEVVVVAKSSSGGRHFGVNVGDYTSRSQAERDLRKVALVESATLNQGLRKISEKGGTYHANFMGLTEDQADLACRRLRARGVSCETLGP